MNKINKMLLLIWFSLDAGLHAGLLLVSYCIAGQSSRTSCAPSFATKENHSKQRLID
ncbi:hypothetical protein V6Z11_D13G227000 [Gossypium hirsutum]